MMLLYLSRIKGTAKRIIDFMYGTRANPTKRTIERDRTMTLEDILDIFHLLRVTDGATEGSGLDDMPAEVAAISAFTKTNHHYTYTLDLDWTPLDKEDIMPDEECNDNLDAQDDNGSSREDTGDILDLERAA